MVDQIEPPRRISGIARGSNRGRLVEVLRRQGPLPRVELARSTGLSFPAVSGLTSRLIAEELLCETETAATSWSEDTDEDDADGLNGRRRGRPAVLLTLNPEFGRIIAVSLRMNLIETLIADFSGFSLAQSRLEIATRALDAGALCDLVITQINAMLEATATPRHRLLGIGIALQGIVNADTGRHLWSPALSVTDIDLAKPVRQAFGTARSIAVEEAGGKVLGRDLRMPALRAQAHQRCVGRHAIYPAGKLGVALEGVELAPDRQERVLQDLLGLGLVAHEPVCQPEHLVLIAFQQRLERGEVLLARARDQFIVGQRRELPRSGAGTILCGHRRRWVAIVPDLHPEP